MKVYVDILIIGGGIQSILILKQLTELGYSAILLIDNQLGSGQTLNSQVSIYNNVNETCINRKKLVRKLPEPIKDLIFKGHITGFKVTHDLVQEVHAIIHRKKYTFVQNSLVLTAGQGNQYLRYQPLRPYIKQLKKVLWKLLNLCLVDALGDWFLSRFI